MLRHIRCEAARAGSFAPQIEDEAYTSRRLRATMDGSKRSKDGGTARVRRWAAQHLRPGRAPGGGPARGPRAACIRVRRFRGDRERLRDRPAHAPAAHPRGWRRPAHRRDDRSLAMDASQSRDRRQPQRRRLPLVLQAHGGIHPATSERRVCAAGHAGVLGHAAARAAPDGRARRARGPGTARVRSVFARRGGMARLPLGPCGRAVHPRSGLPPARPGLAAPFRGALRIRSFSAGFAVSRLPRWPCPIIPTSPTNSSRR